MSRQVLTALLALYEVTALGRELSLYDTRRRSLAEFRENPKFVTGIFRVTSSTEHLVAA